MAGLIRMSLDSPEETRPFEDGKGKLELVNLEGGPVGRATFEPGWQWSKHVQHSGTLQAPPRCSPRWRSRPAVSSRPVYPDRLPGRPQNAVGRCRQPPRWF